MKYKLATSRIKPIELVLLALIIIALNYLFLDYFTGLFLLADIGLVILFFYRVYDYLFVQYPVWIETGDKSILVTYDRGLKRSLSYSYVRDVNAYYDENTDNYRLYIYLKKKRPLKDPRQRVSGKFMMEEADAKKIIQDIRKRADLI